MAKQRMAGRRVAAGDRKRDLILMAARKVFEQEGLDGASLRAIAAAAGYTPAALYFHFDSKEAIYAEVLRRSLVDLEAAIGGALARARTPAARLRAAALTFFRHYADNPRDLDLGFYLFRGGMKPRGHLLFPPTTLVEVEDTQNRMGGLVWDRAELESVCAAARDHGAASYLDGARLLNAAAARDEDPAALAAPFDLASIALSKGLGCPGGSVLAGTREDIAALRRYRRMLGGAMRQAGVLAAAGLYALDHHVDRLPEDHANARAIGERLAAVDGVRVDLDALETNIVVFRLAEGAPDAATVVARAKERGVLVMAFAARTVRAVTHLDVSAEDCATAADVLAESVAG